MSLLKCPECNGTMSSLAKTCPHCGAPTRTMSQWSIEYDGEIMDASAVLTAMHENKGEVKHRIWDMCNEAEIPEDDMTIAGFVDQIYELFEKKYGYKAQPIELWIPPSEASLRQAAYEREYEEIQKRKSAPPTPNLPKCPTCGSTNLQKLNAATRAIDGWFFGRHSVEGRAQFWCKNCDYRW